MPILKLKVELAAASKTEFFNQEQEIRLDFSDDYNQFVMSDMTATKISECK